ncbi:MAG: two-component sensor histidine kinase [Oscillospiraceae bacterium]|nr:two-component sensor histidine kinase [Oscillospiraceae bacterium]
MTRTVFRSCFLMGVIVLLLCVLLFFGLQYRQVMDETYAALQQEAVYAEHGLMISGQPYLETLDKVNRITWITAEGDVIYDSVFSQPIANQLHCREVSAALETGEGQGIRKSESSGEETMYYALVCEDGSILRLSRPLSAVRYAFVAVSPVLWVLVLVLLISGLLAFQTAKQIVKPINALKLDQLDSAPYPELTPLISHIREQKQTILEQVGEQEQLRREFSANVSHELKTPLTSISGFAELMAKGDVPADRVKEFSSDIYRESRRMITLVDDIIRLSRLDEGGTGLPEEPVDLYALSSEILDELRSVAEKDGIRLTLEGEPVEVTGVRQLLGEAVYNLCDNAIKYNTSGGSVTVRIEQPDADGRTALSVRDTGIGIPAEHQKRVFERFYRVDKSHSRAIGGTGLGLSIVKHVALFHNAELSMDSTPGKGTTITMRFPPERSRGEEHWLIHDRQRSN